MQLLAADEPGLNCEDAEQQIAIGQSAHDLFPGGRPANSISSGARIGPRSILGGSAIFNVGILATIVSATRADLQDFPTRSFKQLLPMTSHKRPTEYEITEAGKNGLRIEAHVYRPSDDHRI